MKYPQLVSMPSAVSNWLEEQLEARGIDAVLYTRYVLSLLHAHTVDVIYPDEDLQFSRLKKEVKRSSGGGGSRKRFRRSSDWWRHAPADADQLKRSAAVECLMSASDQNCEIESLVDELCEKLKEIKKEENSEDIKEPNSSSSVATSSTSVSDGAKESKQASPKEQAAKYYAAFPPLCRNNSTSPTKLISLIPKWIQSPKKKPNRKNNRSSSYESKLHAETMKASRTNSSKRYNYFGRNKKTEICRNMAKSVDNWDFCSFNNNNNNMQLAQDTNITNTFVPEMSDQSLDLNFYNPNDEEMNMYDDLAVDIRELLDSPSPQNSVEMMNLANMRDNGKRGFIPCGTNITTSIWSNDQMDDIVYDNKYNSAKDSENILDIKFSSISIDELEKSAEWPQFDSNVAQNEKNSYFENQKKSSSFLEGFHSLPTTTWSNNDSVVDEECFENEHLLNRVAVSLMQINHDKELSSFTEIIPKKKSDQLFNPFGNRNSRLFNFNSRKESMEKEDLLTSEKSHFRPINEKLDSKRIQGQYADGSTFIISNNLDKVNYKRSESGSMYVECEYGTTKKYCKYDLDTAATEPQPEFVLKFCVAQNDKGCQTEANLSNFSLQGELVEITCGSSSDFEADKEVEEFANELKICTCPLNNNNNFLMSLEDTKGSDGIGSCAMHPNRPESMMAEFMWKYETKACDKCNNNAMTWNSDWLRSQQVGSDWDNQTLRNIWNGSEICQACMNINGGRPPPPVGTAAVAGSSTSTSVTTQHSQLREDISQDGEQLLSDLSSLQKCYMDEAPPMAEFSCDLADFFVPKERKRRHSFITAHVHDAIALSRSSWSFASRLEEDCLIQMSTIPTLRSVTL